MLGAPISFVVKSDVRAKYARKIPSKTGLSCAGQQCFSSSVHWRKNSWQSCVWLFEWNCPSEAPVCKHWVRGWWCFVSKITKQCSHVGGSMSPGRDLASLWPHCSIFSASCSRLRRGAGSFLLPLRCPAGHLVPCLPAMMDSYPLKPYAPQNSCFHKLLWSRCLVTTRSHDTVQPLVSAHPSSLCLLTPVTVQSSSSGLCRHFRSIINIQIFTPYLLFGLDWATSKLVCWVVPPRPMLRMRTYWDTDTSLQTQLAKIRSYSTG